MKTAQVRQLTVITRNRETGRVPEIRMAGPLAQGVWLRSRVAPRHHGRALPAGGDRYRLASAAAEAPRGALLRIAQHSDILALFV